VWRFESSSGHQQSGLKIPLSPNCIAAWGFFIDIPVTSHTRIFTHFFTLLSNLLHHICPDYCIKTKYGYLPETR
jgi:hypothetical protein